MSPRSTAVMLSPPVHRWSSSTSSDDRGSHGKEETQRGHPPIPSGPLSIAEFFIHGYAQDTLPKADTRFSRKLNAEDLREVCSRTHIARTDVHDDDDDEHETEATSDTTTITTDDKINSINHTISHHPGQMRITHARSIVSPIPGIPSPVGPPPLPYLKP